MNKKGEGTSLTMTNMFGIIITVIIVAFIFGSCDRLFAQSPNVEIPNYSYVLSLASTLNSGNLNKLFKESIEQNIPQNELPLYDVDLTGFIVQNLKLSKNEFFLFFSSGSEPIKLITSNYKDKISELKFNKPVQCMDNACICYVSDLVLWKTENEKIIIDEEKLQNGFDLKEPVCEIINRENLVFLNSRNYFKSDDYKYFTIKDTQLEEWKKIPLPLEIISIAYYLPEETTKNYLLSTYNNNLQDKPISDFLFSQKWENGVVIGDFGYSTGNKITNDFSQKFKLYLTYFISTDIKIPIVGVSVNTIYSLKSEDKSISELSFLKFVPLLKDNYVSPKQGESSLAKLTFDSLSSSSKPLKEVYITKYLDINANSNLKPEVKIFNNKKTKEDTKFDSFEIYLNTYVKPFNTDVDFYFTEEMPDSICLNSVYINTDGYQGFKSCDNKNYYLFRKLNDEIQIFSYDLESVKCYSYEFVFKSGESEKTLTINNILNVEKTQISGDLCGKSADEKIEIIAGVEFFDGNILYTSNIEEYQNCGHTLKETITSCTADKVYFEGDPELVGLLQFNALMGWN
ncbi:MAG: hypothetical protein AB7V77_03125 [Candidatus Woesearchaeota archaeon]